LVIATAAPGDLQHGLGGLAQGDSVHHLELLGLVA
jgi:hypothetical protein